MMILLCIRSWKHAEARARGVAVPDRFRFRDVGYRMRGRFARYSKLETAKCRPVEDLSALNQTSGQERKQGAASTARSNLRRTTTQRHTILLLKASAPLKRESFIFEHVIHATARGEKAITAVRKQPYPFFLALLNDGFSKLRAPSITNR